MKKKSLNNLSKLIPFLKPHKKEIAMALLALATTALMVLFFGKAIKYLIDFGFVQKSVASLNIFLLILVFGVIVMAVAGFYRSSLINSVAERVVADLRKKVYSHTLQMSAQFFEVTKTGDVISRLTVDSVVLYEILSSTFAFFLRNSLLFLGGICFLFFTSVKLTLISLILISLAISPILFMGRVVKKLSYKSQEALAVVGSHVEETVNGIKTIQAYLRQKQEEKNFDGKVESALKIALQKIQVRSLLIAIVISLAFGGIAVVLWIGGHDVLNAKMSAGELSSFIFYAIIVATSLVSLSHIMSQLQTASAACERIFLLLETESSVKEKKLPQEFLPVKEIKIEFHGVQFSYPLRSESSVFDNFNLAIKPQEKIAIVGPSGSGKSTLFQLLMRFYDVGSGEITLNGINIKNLSLHDLRKNFSYISQDCFIFSGTIFENIAYIDKNVSRQEVENLIEKNPALHFIKDFPQGLDSFVGEKGIKLSGGERQRIALARAIVKDSPILLLDEATSSLDNQNEHEVIKAIAELAEHKTVITIAHRLSTVIAAQRILFLKNGQIIEEGAHGELIAKGGVYKRMYELEFLKIFDF